MQKGFIYIFSAITLASCASDSIVDTPAADQQAQQMAVQFTAQPHNTTRATMLQDVEHYNFGVFGYKHAGSDVQVFANHLVGYHDPKAARGYYMTSDRQTTLGDAEEVIDGKSYWSYEKMGSADYTYSGNEGYFRQTDEEYMSNLTHQQLEYWDPTTPYSVFYAYTPYLHGASSATFDASSSILSLPSTSLTDGYDRCERYEYMWAAAQVPKAEYGKDVWLRFHRLNAKVNIKFYEEVDGYSVQIIDLLEGKYSDVQAAPAIREDSLHYLPGEYYSSAGYEIDFSGSMLTPAIRQTSAQAESASRPLIFRKPDVAAIGTSRATASASPTTYFALPKTNTTGFTFHVSFILTSDKGETLVVKDATAFVTPEMCNWKSNTSYTYIFKIARRNNGSTDPDKDPDIDPTKPDPDPEEELYPIVFDGASVEVWTPEEKESEHKN